MKIYHKQLFVYGLIYGVFSLFFFVLILLKGNSTQEIEFAILIFLCAVTYLSRSFMKTSSYQEIMQETDERERRVWFQSASKTLDILESVGCVATLAFIIAYIATKQRGWRIAFVASIAYGALTDLIMLVTYRYFIRQDEQRRNDS